MRDLAPLEQQLTEMFRDKLHLAVPSSDTDLFETAGLDSLSLVALLLHLEDEFGLKISLADLELDNFRSIARLAKFIAHHAMETGVRDEEQSPAASAGHGPSIRHG